MDICLSFRLFLLLLARIVMFVVVRFTASENLRWCLQTVPSRCNQIRGQLHCFHIVDLFIFIFVSVRVIVKTDELNKRNLLTSLKTGI